MFKIITGGLIHMSLVEAMIIYRHGLCSNEDPVPVARTKNPLALAVVKEVVLQEVREEGEMWARIDPGLAEMHQAEAHRLEEVLEYLLPKNKSPPDLKVFSSND
jgi:hypothetical protein